MVIPKRIDAALTKRRQLAEELERVCNIVDDFINSTDGLADEIDPADFLGGVEIYANPKASENAIRLAIRNHKQEKK